jgi:hypothetical protein
VLNSFSDPEQRISKGCDRSGHTIEVFLAIKLYGIFIDIVIEIG